MAYEDSFGFTHLVEDSDDDDNALDMSNSHLDLQPHLSSLETATSITGDVEHADPQYSEQTASKYASSSNDVPSNPMANGISASARKTVPVGDIESAPPSMDYVEGGGASDDSDYVNGSGAGQSIEWSEPAEPVSMAPVQTNVQVQYSNAKGQVQVVQQSVATRPDGSYYINTHGVPEQWSEPERPLRKKRILLLKIFSIVACIFFFPSGIAAAYYAFQIDKEFNEGIMRGNIDKAQKFAKRSERLIVLSLVLSIVLATLIVALVERPYTGNNDHASGVAVG